MSKKPLVMHYRTRVALSSGARYSGWLRITAPGTFGENLTTAGLDVSRAVVGERWRVGTATLRVTEPRLPCQRLALRMDDARFPARFTDAGRVRTSPSKHPGPLAPGDEIEVLDRPAHDLTIRDVVGAYHGDPSRLAQIFGNPHLSPAWLDGRSAPRVVAPDLTAPERSSNPRPAVSSTSQPHSLDHVG